MTFEQLRLFVAVAEREHMTRAAEAVGLTQSALSAAISNLEARYGVVLFHRVGRRIELTEGGCFSMKRVPSLRGLRLHSARSKIWADSIAAR